MTMTLAEQIEHTILFRVKEYGKAMIDEYNLKYYQDKLSFDINKFCLTNDLDYVKDKNGIYTITKINNVCINCD